MEAEEKSTRQRRNCGAPFVPGRLLMRALTGRCGSRWNCQKMSAAVRTCADVSRRQREIAALFATSRKIEAAGGMTHFPPDAEERIGAGTLHQRRLAAVVAEIQEE